jgi:hypothetical protein
MYVNQQITIIIYHICFMGGTFWCKVNRLYFIIESELEEIETQKKYIG